MRPEHETPAGHHFDDLEVGRRFESPGRTVTEADLVAFAGLSGDFNSLHTDREFARRTPFRERIAHGMLVQSIGTGLASRIGVFEGTVAALQEMRIEFQSPVRIGDTVRIGLEVVEKDPEPSRRSGWVRFRTAIRNQRDELVVDGFWRVLMLRRPQKKPARSPE